MKIVDQGNWDGWPPEFSETEYDVALLIAENTVATDQVHDIEREMYGGYNMLPDEESEAQLKIAELRKLQEGNQGQIAQLVKKAGMSDWIDWAKEEGPSLEVKSALSGLPTFDHGPIKDAKPMASKAKKPMGVDRQEVKAALPDGVSLGQSGYGKAYGS